MTVFAIIYFLEKKEKISEASKAKYFILLLAIQVSLLSFSICLNYFAIKIFKRGIIATIFFFNFYSCRLNYIGMKCPIWDFKEYFSINKMIKGLG